MPDTTGQARFSERRRLARKAWGFLGFVLVGIPAWGWLQGELHTLADLAWGIGGGLAFAVFTFLVMLSPGGRMRRHVRVDDAGLHVGGQFLPVECMGRIEELNDNETTKAHFLHRIRGMWVSSKGSSVNVQAGGELCVLVEALRPGRNPRAWVVASRRPEALADALRGLQAEHAAADRCGGRPPSGPDAASAATEGPRESP